MIARTDGRRFYCSFCPILTMMFQHVSRKIPTFFCGGKTLIGRQREAGTQGGRSLVMHEEPPRHTVTFG
jgi:hypothetical protein